jgi:hypothetical protein
MVTVCVSHFIAVLAPKEKSFIRQSLRLSWQIMANPFKLAKTCLFKKMLAKKDSMFKPSGIWVLLSKWDGAEMAPIK